MFHSGYKPQRFWCILMTVARPWGRVTFPPAVRTRPFPDQRRQQFFYEGRPGANHFPGAGQVSRMNAFGKLTALPPIEDCDGHKLRSINALQNNQVQPEARGKTLDIHPFGSCSRSRNLRIHGPVRTCGQQHRNSDPVTAILLLSDPRSAVLRG